MAISFPSFQSLRQQWKGRTKQRSVAASKPRSSKHPSSKHPSSKYPSSKHLRSSATGFSYSQRETLRSGIHLPNSLRQLHHPLRSPEIRSSYQASPKQLRFRLILVWGSLLIAMLALLLNLFRIQVLQASVLKERARSQQMIYLNPLVPRRPIVDRQGTVLALDQPVYTLYAHPILFQKPAEEIAVSITSMVKQPPPDLVQRFHEGESGIRVVDGLTEDIARQISTLQLDGLELVPEQQRIYPQKDLFADIVGYVNLDRKGQSGVEYSFEKQLQHPIDAMTLTRTGDGSVLPVELPNNFLQQQQDDLRLQLTLDSRLQRSARLSLHQQVSKYKAKRGAVMVMDAHDGSILALASEPSFDPNEYYKANLEQLRNWVVTDLYEPGSTFKPINVAIALQAGSVRPDDTFLDEGAIEVGGWPIRNSDFEDLGARGTLSVREILQYSSNVGMVRMMQTLESGVYYGWLSRLQLDKVTGIDLPSEAAGQMKGYEQFTNAIIEPATTAFGQGFSLTPIKLLQLHGMLANGGKMLAPHIVQGLANASGELKWQPESPAPRQIFSPGTTRMVLSMMEQAVLQGTGQAAQIEGYRIGGKTGTAQKASPDGGYTSARITSFVATFPIDAPRYVVLCVVDEPQGEDAYGSTVAAPVVKTVIESLITIEQIPPSDLVIDPALEENQELDGSGESEDSLEEAPIEDTEQGYDPGYVEEYIEAYAEEYQAEGNYAEEYTEESAEVGVDESVTAW